MGRLRSHERASVQLRGMPVVREPRATCCRTCLEWLGIEKGRALTEEELAYAVEVVVRWIEREARR